MNKDRFHTILAETIEWEIRSKVYLSVQTNWETAKKLYDECLDFYHKILLWLLQEEDFSKNQIHKISQKGAESYHSLWFSIEETVKIIVSDSSAERETISYATLQVREKIGTLIIRKPSFYNPNTPISWNSDREWGKKRWWGFYAEQAAKHAQDDKLTRQALWFAWWLMIWAAIFWGND